MRSYRVQVLLFLLFVAIALPRSSVAIMVKPKNIFEPVSEGVLEKVRQVEKLKFIFQRDEPSVHLAKIEPWGEVEGALPLRYILVRLETRICTEWCPTAIFRKEISEEGYQALVYLPTKAARSDVGQQICMTCKSSWPMIFASENRRGKAIFFTKFGPIF